MYHFIDGWTDGWTEEERREMLIKRGREVGKRRKGDVGGNEEGKKEVRNMEKGNTFGFLKNIYLGLAPWPSR